MTTTKPNRYQSGKIYKLIDNSIDEFYIGTSCEPTLSRTLATLHQRIKLAKANNKNLSYSDILTLPGSKPVIILIEKYPCNTKDELRTRQQHHIDLNKSNKKMVNCKGINSVVVVSDRTIGANGTDDKKWNIGIVCDNRKFKCWCGGTFTVVNMYKHKRTKKHINTKKEDVDKLWGNAFLNHCTAM